MVVLTLAQAAALEAFCECFDLNSTGLWSRIEDDMREDFGIIDPEGDLESARRALRGEADEE